MGSARACFRLALAFAFLVVVLHSVDGKCNSNQIECKTRGQCINKYNICDGSSHCVDGSDEEHTMCQFWPSTHFDCGYDRKFYKGGGCRNILEICRNSGWSSTINPKVCEIVLQSKLGPPQKDGQCSGDRIECRTGRQCIYEYNVCDGTRHCPDGSDEDDKICKLWPPVHPNCRRQNKIDRFYNGASCTNVKQMCRNSVWALTIDQRICKIVLQPKLEPLQEGMNMTNEVVGLLSSAVNSTLTKRKPDCPMLYNRVGKDCLSFFSPAKVSWPEARHFCRSIYGDLWHFTDIAAYGALLAFIREEQFTSDYWIGRRFDLDTNAWSWTTDDSVMPLGAPYWKLKYNDSCVRRGPPHTDPFSDPPAAPLGGRCYHTELSPKERSSGWCAAMTYENFFYWSDEKCDEAFSPLCILTEPIVSQEAADSN